MLILKVFVLSTLSGSTADPTFILPAFTATNGTNNVTFVFASGSGAY
jgi:hypothetical protein